MKELLGEIAKLREREQRLIELTNLLVGEIELDELLDRVVTGLRSVTDSDGGSLYLAENKTELRFAVAQNDSKDIPFSTFKIPIDHNSIAGYAAATGETLRFDDVYQIEPSQPFQFSSSFDERFDYRTMSMLVVPLQTRNGKTVGVVQLINKKKDPSAKLSDSSTAAEQIVSYSQEDADFLNIVACQAALAIERAQLYDGIEKLLRGMVEASAASIESRDKTTAGHSQRIAGYTVAFAKRINKCNEGFFKGIHFTDDQIRELFYAAMLHDVGKIGVRENVLTKANKLSNDRLETIHLRIGMQIIREPEKKECWENIWNFIKEINIPGFLPDDKLEKLTEYRQIIVTDHEGEDRPLLDDFEFENLSVRKGNLTAAERIEIESHVAHSLSILNQIPWTDDLKRVPIIAGTHHERLSGKGYPNGLTKDEIPFEGRMLAVVDVFEALTAMDRPYKPAMPIDKAIEILGFEVKGGGLQKEIVDFFVDNKVYEVISDKQRQNFTMTSDELMALE